MLKIFLNYKYSFIISLLVLILGLLYLKKRLLPKKRVKINEAENKVIVIDDNENKKFIKSNNFDGKKLGYVFKTSELGTGYYLDKK